MFGTGDWKLGIWNWELGTSTAIVSRYDPAGAVSTRQPVAFDRVVRFPSDSDLSEAYRRTGALQYVNSSPDLSGRGNH